LASDSKIECSISSTPCQTFMMTLVPGLTEGEGSTQLTSLSWLAQYKGK